MLKNKLLAFSIFIMIAAFAAACGPAQAQDPTPLPYTPAPKPTSVPPTATTAVLGDAVHGKAVFDQSCTTCHSVNAGEILDGPSLSSAGTRFTVAYVKESIEEPCPKVIISSETDKKCVSDMPADFKQKLSTTDFDDVVAYVMSLKK